MTEESLEQQNHDTPPEAESAEEAIAAEEPAEEVANDTDPGILLEATETVTDEAKTEEAPAAVEEAEQTSDEDSGAEEEEEEAPPPSILKSPPDDGIKRRWYAIHAHSGQEANVQQALRVQAEIEGLQDLITNIFVPMEEVAVYKSGEKKLSQRRYFPGYVLVQLPEHPEKNADLWHLIKDTPGVTGFIGSRTEPVPLEDSEVTALVEEIQGERERPRPKVEFEVGERVKINDCAFSNFLGNIG